MSQSSQETAHELFKIVYEELGLNSDCIDQAKRIAIKICEQISLSNPTIKGVSNDLGTMIVQTKAHYALVIEDLQKL